MKQYIFALLTTSALLLADSIMLEPIVVFSQRDDNTSEIQKNSTAHLNSQVVIQETVPGFKQPIVHGMMGDQILLTVDGVKFTNSLFRDGPNQYYSWIPDDFTVKAHIDDPMSTISNSSLGGAVDRTIGVDASQVSVNLDHDISDHKEVIKYKDAEWEAALLNDKRGNVVTPNGEVAHSAYNQKGILIGHNGQDYGVTKFVMTRSDDVDRTDKFEKGDYYVYELQQYILLSHKVFIPDTNLFILPSFQQFKEKIDRNSPTSKDVDSTDNMYGLQMEGYTDALSGYITYGLVDNFEDIKYETGLITNTYNYNIFSGFLTYHDGIGRKFDYDLKYKYSVMTARGSGLDRTLDNNSVGLDTKYRFGLDNYLFASADLSYKFPTITNLAQARDDSVTEIANPNLKQEQSQTLTIGQYYNGLKVSVFYKKFYDMIIRTQTNISDGNGGYKWQYNNTNEGYMKGINVEYDRKYNNGFGIYAFAELLDGKNDYDYWSKMTPFHSKVKMSQDINVWGNDKVLGEWLYAPKVPDSEMALKDQTDIRIQDHNYGYNIINLGYESKIDSHNKIKLMVNNVFDRTGRVYGSAVDFEERTLNINYTYFF